MESLDTTDEKDLLERLRDGDQAAFAKLYHHYRTRIYGRILKLTGGRDETAAELLQDTFVAVWEKRATVKPTLPFKPWLYKVAENEVYRYYRQLARDARMQEHIVAHFTEAYWHTDEVLFRKETKGLLEQAIAKLAPQRRRVFELCKVDGRSYDEAASILDISPATVRNHLAKAMEQLRAELFKSSATATVIVAAYLLSTAP